MLLQLLKFQKKLDNLSKKDHFLYSLVAHLLEMDFMKDWIGFQKCLKKKIHP